VPDIWHTQNMRSIRELESRHLRHNLVQFYQPTWPVGVVRFVPKYTKPDQDHPEFQFELFPQPNYVDVCTCVFLLRRF
jgi:hypothetical protein